MNITSGSRLGPYEILARIAVGGMGEVWSARDTRLQRTVAIKILSDEMASDEATRRRFEREAQTVSRLAHPNICALFDVGPNYLVMELLEGETLRERLLRGPLSIEDVVRFGIQIADALDKAHREGIVHRDLKPGNVMLTKSGAKLLDFGLAKPIPGAGPPISRSLTEKGWVLGTVQYMAPEQLHGLEADARTDVFAFGALLYEMISGRPAFEADSNPTRIAKILTADPLPLSAVKRRVSPALERLVRRCLAKDPSDRWQTIRDVADELRWIATAGPDAGHVATGRFHLRLQHPVGTIAAWVVATLAMAAGIWYARRSDLRPMTVDIEPPRGMEVVNQAYGAPALSPDGSRLAYVFGAHPVHLTGGLVLRDLATGRSRVLPDTQGATFPFWSPDGASIGFFADRRLKVLDVDTAAVRVICDAATGRGGTWSANGVIVFSPALESPLFRVAAAGGKPTPLTRMPGPAWSHRLPHFLPDGEHFLFVERNRGGAMPFGRISVASLRDPTPRVLIEQGSGASYANGYLVYSPDGRRLVAHRFDADTLRLQGEPATIADDIWYYNARDIAYASVSSTGLLVYRRAPLRRKHIVITDRSGRDVREIRQTTDEVTLHDLSGDGRWAVVIMGNDVDGRDVWLIELLRGTMLRATAVEAKAAMSAICDDDCRRLIVSVQGVAPDGSKTMRWIQSRNDVVARRDALPVEQPFTVEDWSRDGRYVAGVFQQPATAHDIGYIDLQGTRKVIPLLAGRAMENHPHFSPDGKWIAYFSSQSSEPRAYVAPFPTVARTWLVADVDADRVDWSPDGRELLLDAGGGVVHAVRVDFRSGEPKFGAPVRLPFSGLGRAIIVGRDRFLAVRPVPDAPEPLRLVSNWTALVK